MDPDYWLNTAWELLIREIKDWIDDVFHLRWTQAGEHWFNVTLYVTSLADLIVERIEQEATKVTNAIEERATDIIGVLEEGADNIVTQLGSIWNSTASLWDQFGPTISSTVTTVEQWVAGAFDTASAWATQAWKDVVSEVDAFYTWVIDWGNDVATWYNENASKVWDWIRDRSTAVWDWIRDNSGTVWDWIRDKSGNVWDWIIGAGANVESWYDEQYDWLSDLYVNKRDRLAEFLDDPGKFIADWVVDSLEYIVAECVFRFW